MRGKKIYKPGDNGKYQAIVYRRYEDVSGKSYIGTTTDFKTRNRSFKKPHGNYAGKKMMAAMESIPKDKWHDEILEALEADTPEELKKLMTEKEAFYIEKFNSYENGYNGNLGGSGLNGLKLDEAGCKQNGDNRRGKPQPPESVKKGVETRRRNKANGTTKQKPKSNKPHGNKGRTHTPEQNAAKSERLKGIIPEAATKAAAEWRKKNGGGPMKGKKLSPASIAQKQQTHRLTSQRIRVIAPDGTINCYLCQADARNATGISDGSINYARKHGGLHTASGYRFEDITPAEYDAWLASNATNDSGQLAA